MYLLTIRVPIYVDGATLLITSEWKRSLVLLRDSLQDRFGAVTVLAPSVPLARGASPGHLDTIESEKNLRLVPSFDGRCTPLQYWTRERARWRSDLARHVATAEVVHAGMDDVYRPITFEGFREAVRQRKPTVFVEDTDIVAQQAQFAERAAYPARLRSYAYALAYERMTRWAVGKADLCLLKGGLLMERYGGFARNPRQFHDTSYVSNEIVSQEALERRLGRMRPGRRLRFVYCGRLVPRKGVANSIRMLRDAARQGADLTLDVIGEGPERPALEARAREDGIADRVTFLGSAEYGPALLRSLSDYDGLLFTPSAEDTPRMIFDGYAAGLPLIATGIAYVIEREHHDGAVLLLSRTDHGSAVAALVDAWRAPHGLARLACAARAAAVYHAADAWYLRRAEWTFEAVDRARLRRLGAVRTFAPE